MKRQLGTTPRKCPVYVVETDTYSCSDVAEHALLHPKRVHPLIPASSFELPNIGIDEFLVWQLLSGKKHVLVSGKAGSGKSHLLSRFVARALESLPQLSVELCAPTGVAAFNVNGETLHRKLGLGLAEESARVLIARISQNRHRYAKTWKFLLETNVLIIDEISMLSSAFFTKLSHLLCLARNCMVPFGGVLLVMVGDFTQLGPVFSGTEERKLVFECGLWQKMPLARIILDRSYRQQTDQTFLKLLNRVRTGTLTEEDVLLLESKTCAAVESKTIASTHVQPLHIYPYRNEVERMNLHKLKALETGGAKVYCFKPYLHVRKRAVQPLPMNQTEYKKAQQLIKDKRQMSQLFLFTDLSVCVGAQVMMRSNTHIDRGVFNGSVGIVTCVQDNVVSVTFLHADSRQPIPVEVTRASFRRPFEKTVEIVLDQFPLTLSWASTIHKVQGLTLDHVLIDVRKCFEAGQFYVGISRVRSLENLSLLGFSKNSVIVHPAAVDFELNIVHDWQPPSKKLKSCSAQDEVCHSSSSASEESLSSGSGVDARATF